MKPIWRRQQVEDLALITLLDFRRQTGLPLVPPVDVDLVGEIVCRLSWDWDVLEEPPGTLIWAALFPEERAVVLNETHKDKFIEKSGLERFTKGHEIGHWVLHVNNPKREPTMQGRGLGQTRSGQHDHSCHSRHGHSRQMFCRGESPKTVNWLEKHADWFAGALLMPASVFVPIAEQHDLREWKSLYDLSRLFDVTISALCVRLAHLGLSYVDEQGQIHSPQQTQHSVHVPVGASPGIGHR